MFKNHHDSYSSKIAVRVVYLCIFSLLNWQRKYPIQNPRDESVTNVTNIYLKKYLNIQNSQSI